MNEEETFTMLIHVSSRQYEGTLKELFPIYTHICSRIIIIMEH